MWFCSPFSPTPGALASGPQTAPTSNECCHHPRMSPPGHCPTNIQIPAFFMPLRLMASTSVGPCPNPHLFHLKVLSPDVSARPHWTRSQPLLFSLSLSLSPSSRPGPMTHSVHPLPGPLVSCLRLPTPRSCPHPGLAHLPAHTPVLDDPSTHGATEPFRRKALYCLLWCRVCPHLRGPQPVLLWVLVSLNSRSRPCSCFSNSHPSAFSASARHLACSSS